MRAISGLFAGLLFGVGLAASGMTDTAKVIGFLNIFGAWDRDLLFVMGSAVITAGLGYKIVLRRQQPIFERDFLVPTISDIDGRLIGGAALFGLGWGLYGYCPGPAIAALVYLSPITLGFVVAMLLGMAIGNRLVQS
ncbi:MAG: YeeE/YedE family protein [Gammaproteobacteria bacterium]|nr:YeeE/YedE family protein [Gammaproteobacteria bacterium]